MEEKITIYTRKSLAVFTKQLEAMDSDEKESIYSTISIILDNTASLSSRQQNLSKLFLLIKPVFKELSLANIFNNNHQLPSELTSLLKAALQCGYQPIVENCLSDFRATQSITTKRINLETLFEKTSHYLKHADEEPRLSILKLITPDFIKKLSEQKNIPYGNKIISGATYLSEYFSEYIAILFIFDSNTSPAYQVQSCQFLLTVASTLSQHNPIEAIKIYTNADAFLTKIDSAPNKQSLQQSLSNQIHQLSTDFYNQAAEPHFEFQTKLNEPQHKSFINLLAVYKKTKAKQDILSYIQTLEYFGLKEKTRRVRGLLRKKIPFHEIPKLQNKTWLNLKDDLRKLRNEAHQDWEISKNTTKSQTLLANKLINFLQTIFDRIQTLFGEPPQELQLEFVVTGSISQNKPCFYSDLECFFVTNIGDQNLEPTPSQQLYLSNYTNVFQFIIATLGETTPKLKLIATSGLHCDLPLAKLCVTNKELINKIQQHQFGSDSDLIHSLLCAKPIYAIAGKFQLFAEFKQHLHSWLKTTEDGQTHSNHQRYAINLLWRSLRLLDVPLISTLNIKHWFINPLEYTLEALAIFQGHHESLRSDRIKQLGQPFEKKALRDTLEVINQLQTLRFNSHFKHQSEDNTIAIPQPLISSLNITRDALKHFRNAIFSIMPADFLKKTAKLYLSHASKLPFHKIKWHMEQDQLFHKAVADSKVYENLNIFFKFLNIKQDLYAEIYQSISRDNKLFIVKLFSNQYFACNAVFQKILMTPHIDGWRYEMEKSYNAFTKSLKHIFVAKSDVEIKSSNSPYAVFCEIERAFPEPSQIQTYAFKPFVLKSLFKDAYHFKDKDPRQNSLHNVLPIYNRENSKPLFWAKLYPEDPAAEYSVFNLGFRVGDKSVVPSLLINVMVPDENGLYHANGVLITPHVTGEKLSKVISHSPERLSNVCQENFTRHLLRVLLTNPEDDKENDYFLHNGILSRIDNERAFFTPEDAKKKKLQVKSIIYCFDHMKKQLNKKVLAELANLDPYEVIKSWLADLKQIFDYYRALFPNTVDVYHHYMNRSPKGKVLVEKYSQDKKQQLGSHLFVKVEDYLAKELYERLDRIISCIKENSTKEINLTGISLLAITQPSLSKYYQEAFQKYPADMLTNEKTRVKKRFDWVTVELYALIKIVYEDEDAKFTEELVLRQSKMSGMELITRGRSDINNRFDENNLPKHLNGEYCCPQTALIELQKLKTQNIHTIKSQLLETDKNITPAFRQLTSRSQKVILDWFLSLFKRDGNPPTREQQLLLLQLLSYTRFVALDLSLLASHLTNNRLKEILKKTGNYLLQLNLSGCYRLTQGFLVGNISETIVRYCPNLNTLNLSATNLISFSGKFQYLIRLVLNDCMKLKSINLYAEKLAHLELNHCYELQEFNVATNQECFPELKGVTKLKNADLLVAGLQLSKNSMGSQFASEMLNEDERHREALIKLYRKLGKAKNAAQQHGLPLHTINLSSTKIGNIGVKHLVEFLIIQKTIRFINLNLAGIGNKGAKTLLEFLKINKKIISIQLKNNNVSLELLTEINQISIQRYLTFQVQVAESHGRYIKRIELSSHTIYSDTVEILIQFLSKYPSVAEINLGDCIINEKALRLFLSVLEKSKTIKIIKLNNISLNSRRAFLLLQCFRSNKGIANIQVNNTNNSLDNQLIHLHIELINIGRRNQNPSPKKRIKTEAKAEKQFFNFLLTSLTEIDSLNQNIKAIILSKRQQDNETEITTDSFANYYAPIATSDSAPNVDMGHLQESEYDYLFKIVMVGPGASGKSSVMHQYNNKQIPPLIATIGVDFSIKMIALAGTVIKLQIWDTAGISKFRKITRLYYKGAHCFLLFFSIESSALEYSYLLEILGEIKTYGYDPTSPIMLVGNKIDLRNDGKTSCLSFDEILNLRFALGNLPYRECSAKTGEGVDEIFRLAARLVRDRLELDIPPKVIIPTPPQALEAMYKKKEKLVTNLPEWIASNKDFSEKVTKLLRVYSFPRFYRNEASFLLYLAIKYEVKKVITTLVGQVPAKAMLKKNLYQQSILSVITEPGFYDNKVREEVFSKLKQLSLIQNAIKLLHYARVFIHGEHQSTVVQQNCVLIFTKLATYLLDKHQGSDKQHKQVIAKTIDYAEKRSNLKQGVGRFLRYVFFDEPEHQVKQTNTGKMRNSQLKKTI